MSEATKGPEVAAAVPEVTFLTALKNRSHCQKCDDLTHNAGFDPKDSKLHSFDRSVCADCAFTAMRISGGFMWYDEDPEDFLEFPSQPCVFKEPILGSLNGAFTPADDKHACGICVKLLVLLPGVHVHCGRHCPNELIQVNRVRRERSQPARY